MVLLLPKPVEYFVMPFFSFKRSRPAGFGKIAFNIIPCDKFIRMATISLEGTQFGAPGNQNYHKAKAGLDIYFRTHQMNNPIRQRIYGNYIAASDLFQIEHNEKAQMHSYFQIGYVLEKTSIINPFSISSFFEFNNSYQKSSVEFNYRISYRGKKMDWISGYLPGLCLRIVQQCHFMHFLRQAEADANNIFFRAHILTGLVYFPIPSGRGR